MPEVRQSPGGPPVPSLTLVQTDQDTILGDGSHGHPLHASPSALVTSAPVVFRPGGVAAQNVVTTWPDAVTALARVQGERVLQFDDSLVSPIVIPFPASGSYPMRGVSWHNFPGTSPQISIPEGVLFSGLRTFVGVRITFAGLTPPVSDFGSLADDAVVMERATITTSNLGPFFRLFDNGSFRLGEGAAILTGASPVINVATANVATVIADGPFATLRSSTVSGIAGSTLILEIADSAAGDSNGSLLESQPAFLGAIVPRNATADRAYPTGIATGNVVLSSAASVVRVDPTAAGFSVTLPPAALFRGETLVLKNVSSSTNVVVATAGAGDNIDGAATQNLSGALFHWRATSDGVSQWMVTG